jgi:hypothetical protein
MNGNANPADMKKWKAIRIQMQELAKKLQAVQAQPKPEKAR